MANETNTSQIADQTPYRGGIHNIQLTTPENVGTVNPALYAGVMEGEMTYDLKIDAPLFGKVFLYEPDEEDIAQSGGANPF